MSDVEYIPEKEYAKKNKIFLDFVFNRHIHTYRTALWKVSSDF